MSQIAPEPLIQDSNTTGARWMVTIFDNPYNTQQEVAEVLMLATQCDIDEAMMEMWEAETYGKAPVHFSSKEVCDEVAMIISRIGVRTDVALEWAN